MLMGVTSPGKEWWHMKLYTHTPNRLGRPEILDVGGDAGDSFTNFMMARATITMKACHLMRVVAICKYLVLVTLQKTNCPMVQTKTARNIL